MDFWLDLGRQELELALRDTVPNTRIAKNVILFIGDGMSIPTISAARIYKAQQLQGNFDSPEREIFVFWEVSPYWAIARFGSKYLYILSWNCIKFGALGNHSLLQLQNMFPKQKMFKIITKFQLCSTIAFCTNINSQHTI